MASCKDTVRKITDELDYKNANDLDNLANDLIEFKKEFPTEEAYLNNLKAKIKRKLKKDSDMVVSKAAEIVSSDDFSLTSLQNIVEQLDLIENAYELLQDWFDEKNAFKNLQREIKEYLYEKVNSKADMFNAQQKDLLIKLLGKSVFKIDVYENIDAESTNDSNLSIISDCETAEDELVSDDTEPKLETIIKTILLNYIDNDENLLSAMIKEILENGINGINQFADEISPKKYRKLKDELNKCKDLNLKKSNETILNAFLKKMFQEENIKDDDLRQRVTDALLESKSIKIMNDFSEEIAPKKFKRLILKLENSSEIKDIFKNEDQTIDEIDNQSIRDSNIVKNTLEKTFEKLKIANEDNLIERLSNEINSDGLKGLNKFESEIVPRKFSLLKAILIENRELCEYLRMTIKISPEKYLNELILKYNLEEKINYEIFNSLENFSDSLDEYLEEMFKNITNNQIFIKNVFTYMIYMIKRQQNLSDFINDMKYKVLEYGDVSLRELIYFLLLNSEYEVRVKIIQLLHTNNPIPFKNYFLDVNQDEFYHEVYWLMEDSYKKIFSFSLDSKCKGKSRLLNKIFHTSFEKSIKDSLFFNGTIDLQIIRNFGENDNHYCIFDAHGQLEENLLERIIHFFDYLIIHVTKESINDSKMLNLISNFNNNQRVFVFIRDFNVITSHVYCTNQNFVISKLEHKENFSNLTLCAMPSLIEENYLDAFGRNLREFIFKQTIKNFKKNPFKIFNENSQQIIKNIIDRIEPFIEFLEQAIHNNGIKEENILLLYPLYHELYLVQSSLNKLQFYNENRDKVNELSISEMNIEKEINFVVDQIKHKNSFSKSTRYFKSNFLNCSNYTLLLDLLVRKLNIIFQKEMKNKLKEKSDLINRIKDLEKSNKYIEEIEDLKESLDQLNNLIELKRISIEIIWRELMLEHKNKIDCKLASQCFKESILKGFPFEILDGDNFCYNEEFLRDAFDKIPKERIRVISILGPQNSGKSTLLNFMFGCDFTVSDGRCTRGIYGSLIKSNHDEFDYYLILDTEGLQSIEKGDKEYDRKIILFCFSVSNIVIINTKDQINDDVKTTLEVCVDSLKDIEMAKVKQPTVFFVMNQKADPNRKTDQDAINKIISNFTQTGIINQLNLEGDNFETLPSAFNSSVLKINSSNELRYFTTSFDFTRRVFKFAKNIINQAKTYNEDGSFSSLKKWVEFSSVIFKTINQFPNLTLFNDKIERDQCKKLQDYLNTIISGETSYVIKDKLFNEIKTKSYEEAEADVNNYFQKKIESLLQSYENFKKSKLLSENIMKLKRDYLISQMFHVKNTWLQEFKTELRNKNLSDIVNAGEGIIHERINNLLRSSSNFTKDEAEAEFNKFFKEYSDEISKNINEAIEKNEIFDRIYKSYSAYEKDFPHQNTINQYIKNRSLSDFIELPLCRSDTLKIRVNLLSLINEFKKIKKDEILRFYDIWKSILLQGFDFIESNRTNKDLPTLLFQKFKLGINKNLNYNSLRMTDLVIEPDQIFEYRKSSKIGIVYQFGKNLLFKYKPSEEEISHVIIDYIIRISTQKKNSLLFNEQIFRDEVLHIVHGFIAQNIKLDEEMIKTLISKITHLIEIYNSDYLGIGICLSKQAKSYAHILAFKVVFEYFQDECVSKAVNEQYIWNKKKTTLHDFFISQLCPDKEKDKNNSNQCGILFAEAIRRQFDQKITDEINKNLDLKKDEFTRLHMLNQIDSSFSGCNEEELKEYVLEPSRYLERHFRTDWNSLRQFIETEASKFKNESIKIFDVLLELFKKLSDLFNANLKNNETFKAENIFLSENSPENTLKRSKSLSPVQIAHLKGLCTTQLLFDLLLKKEIKKTYQAISGDQFYLKHESKLIIDSIKVKVNTLIIDSVIECISSIQFNFSIQYIDLFLKMVIESIVVIKKEFEKEKTSLDKFDTNLAKYLERVKGCGFSCPCCGRLCDKEHFRFMTEKEGYGNNKHICDIGHQFRAMNGYRHEHNNNPSFKICNEMKDKDRILYKGRYFKWSEFKELFPSWDFESSETNDETKSKRRCTYIWSRIGKIICEHFKMNFQLQAFDIPDVREPVHFILLLDRSGSMNDKSSYSTKWDELIKSLDSFLDIRSGNEDDLITVITFNHSASLILKESKVEKDLIENFKLKSISCNGGTDFSNALKCGISCINEDKRLVKFTLVFMSDGEADYPENEINIIKQNYMDKIKKFICIGYGENQEFDSLKTMVMNIYGSGENFKNPSDLNELEEVYAEIARET